MNTDDPADPDNVARVMLIADDLIQKYGRPPGKQGPDNQRAQRAHYC
jgi:hypothetical protein